MLSLLATATNASTNVWVDLIRPLVIALFGIAATLVTVFASARAFSKRVADERNEALTKTVDALKENIDAVEGREEQRDKDYGDLTTKYQELTSKHEATQSELASIRRFAAPEAFAELRELIIDGQREMRDAIISMAKAVAEMAEHRGDVVVEQAGVVHNVSDDDHRMRVHQAQVVQRASAPLPEHLTSTRAPAKRRRSTTTVKSDAAPKSSGA